MRDLPRPASPGATTTWPSPALRPPSGAAAEITNDGHARRDADTAPHRQVRTQGPDRRTQLEPRADRPLGVVFVRRGIAEKDEYGIPDTAGDEPIVATDRL